MYLLRAAAAIGLLFSSLAGVPASAETTDPASLSFTAEGKTLRSWSLEELKAKKPVMRREKDPASGQLVNWQGIQLSTLIDETLKDLTAEQRARIDLVILRGANGAQALVPRWFIQRYPVLVATARDSKGLGEKGPFYSVVPWTTVAKVSKEAVPLESFFIGGMDRVEFTNSREHFGRYYLKRRSDPAAVRGEKLFVQSCATCHSTAAPSLEALTSVAGMEKLTNGGHPAVPGAAKLTDREIRALNSYVEELRNSSPDGSRVATQ